MFDASKLTVDHMYKSIAGPTEYGIFYTYGSRPQGLAYVNAKDELGAFQELLKQLEEVYKNG